MIRVGPRRLIEADRFHSHARRARQDQCDTIFDWHRRLVAKKWTYAGGAHGNAEAMKAITKHVVRMARDLTWGFTRSRLPLSKAN